MKTRNKVLLIQVVGLAVAVLALLGPWWHIDGRWEDVEVTNDFGLMGVTKYAFGNSTFSDYSDAPKTQLVMRLAFSLVVATLVLSLLSVVLSVRAGHKAFRNRRLFVLSILPSILLLVSLLYVAAALPGSMGRSADGAFEGFWGEISRETDWGNIRLAWGAAWGWFAGVTAVGLLVLGATRSYVLRPTPRVVARPETQAPILAAPTNTRLAPPVVASSTVLPTETRPGSSEGPRPRFCMYCGARQPEV